MNLNKCKWLGILFLIWFTTSSCSMFQGALKKAQIQEKMASYCEAEAYETSLNEMKTAIEASLNRSVFDGKWISVSSPGFQDQKTMEAINEEMEEGFFYKGRLYTSTWSFSESLSELGKAKDQIFKAKYHLLESHSDAFLLVKGSTIFEATRISEKKTKLKISKLTGIIRPLTINFDWWNLIKGKGLTAFFDASPVDFEESRSYAVVDRNQMLDFFYFFDKEKALNMEKEFEKSL